MDRAALETWLKTSGIPSDAYTVFKRPRDESLCLCEEGGLFSVFYSERGMKTEPHTFEHESEACKHFAKRIGGSFSVPPP
jgi:hypothetical protein